MSGKSNTVTIKLDYSLIHSVVVACGLFKLLNIVNGLVLVDPMQTFVRLLINNNSNLIYNVHSVKECNLTVCLHVFFKITYNK